MATYALERNSLKDFIKQNKEKIYETAKNNTRYNANGQAVISKDDPSFNEDKWDEHFKSIDSLPRNMGGEPVSVVINSAIVNDTNSTKIGLTTDKKSILKNLAGSASSKIDFNKVRDEYKYGNLRIKINYKSKL